MALFNIGNKIKNINTGENGVILEIYPPRRGRQMYSVRYDNNDFETDELSTNIIQDEDLTDPFKRCALNIYDSYSEYLKVNTTVKIQSSNNSTISSLKASKTLFRPYQFKPLLKFLNSDNKRVLIADEVGLGKTIEAGHIMLEMKARGELANALVICPMSLRAKWVTELNDKFGLNFIDVDNKRDLLHELRNHNGYVRAAINYDKVSETSEILRYIEEYKVKFSIIVCDESHKLKNGATRRYKGVERLLMCSDSVVLMSATPIMLREDDLYNQLHLLDAHMFDNVEIFRNNMQLNRPFVRALSQLNAGVPLLQIRDELIKSVVSTTTRINDIDHTDDYEINEYFSDYPIYQQIIGNLSCGEDTPSLRAQIQYDLSEMNPMNNIFSRTRKREVTQDWQQAERNPVPMSVNMTEEESDAYEEAIDDYKFEHDIEDEWGDKYNGNFGLVTYKRQLASSVWGCLNDNNSLDRGYDEFGDKRDAKLEALLTVLRTVFENGNKKIIVFAIFKKTLKYLNIRLKKAGYKCALLYGDPSIKKNDVLKEFQYDDSIQILLTSEVGSEGLDMQFCNSLVNYDLPWNPMVVEQRIGRIDRFGQESPKINIYNIVVKESILEDIYSRLLLRIGIFRESIGDLEAILDKEITLDGKTQTIQDSLKAVERDFYSDKLTPEEVERKEREIAQAIENEKLHLEKISEGLTNTLTNDSYFQDQIKKMETNNSYVTSVELHALLMQLIKEKLTTCSLETTDVDDIFEWHISKSDPSILKRFLNQYQPSDIENRKLYNEFHNVIEDKLVIPMTFNQEKAFRDKSLTFINLYHPLIKSAVRFFSESRQKKQNTFFFEMPSGNMQYHLEKGTYMLAIYKITTSRVLFGDKPHQADTLYPILYDIDADMVIPYREVVENFLGRAQVDGRYAPLDEAYKISKEQAEDLRYTMKDHIDHYKYDLHADLIKRIENSKRMRTQQTLRYYDQRIKNMEAAIRDQELKKEYALDRKDDIALRSAENAIRLFHANIRDLVTRREADIEKINRDSQLKVTEQIVSLNLVNLV